LKSSRAGGQARFQHRRGGRLPAQIPGAIQLDGDHSSFHRIRQKSSLHNNNNLIIIEMQLKKEIYSITRMYILLYYYDDGLIYLCDFYLVLGRHRLGRY
jgi:hypothetical protein